ncbi:unnamed protein product [Chilo suppressalis]|uniref:BED-type domain-containing protein n=1 Tax=Chilo suppressalis TaxID=168631 RepID=A0ABN8AVI4_CHISP|nr:unnamed protein product [Chilo suppressalis]
MPRRFDSVWEHFLVVSERDRKKHVTCNYCDQEYKFAQSNRLKEHLMKCQQCPREVRVLYNSGKRNKLAFSTPLLSPSTSQSTCTTESALLTPSTSTTVMVPDSPLLLDNNNSSSQYSHEDVDTLLARAIYASGVPLSLLQSEYWQEVFKLLNPTYTVPSIHCLSNPLLEAEYLRIKKEMDAKIKKAASLALIMDGWTNVTGKGVINFIVTTPKPILLNAILPATQKDTAYFMSEKIINILTEVGPTKFVAVITDNAANMKAVWRIVTKKYTHITCVGCVSHCLNLMFKDVFKIAFFGDILENVIEIIKHIKKSHALLVLFEKCQTEKYGKISCKLKLYSETRWSGAFVTLQTFKENRLALELMTRSHEVNITPQIKDFILDFQSWAKIENAFIVLQPIAYAILASERDNALLSDVPHIFKELYQTVIKQLQSTIFLSEEDKNMVMASIEKRKDFCLQPIHYAAHQLDPRYCGIDLTDDEIAMASEYLCRAATTSGVDAGKVIKSMAEFKHKENFYDERKAMWVPVNDLEPTLWWRTFAGNQDVASIAIKILSVPPSSSACERNWSLFGRTHTKIRNQLNNSRALKLTYIRSNMKLLQKESAPTFIDSSEDDLNESNQSDNDSV